MNIQMISDIGLPTTKVSILPLCGEITMTAFPDWSSTISNSLAYLHDETLVPT